MTERQNTMIITNQKRVNTGFHKPHPSAPTARNISVSTPCPFHVYRDLQLLTHPVPTKVVTRTPKQTHLAVALGWVRNSAFDIGWGPSVVLQLGDFASIPHFWQFVLPPV